MKFNKLVLGSALALSTFGLLACSDDSSSNAKDDDNGNKAPVIDIPQDTEKSPIVAPNTITADLVNPSVFFSGSFSLDLANPDMENPGEVKFTSIEFTVGKLEADGSETASTAVVDYVAPDIAANPQSSLNLVTMSTKIDLSNPAFMECGTFILHVIVKATDGKNPYQTSRTAQFSRPQSYCPEVNPEPESSSAAAPTGIPMTSYEATLASNLKYGIDLASGNTFTAAEVAAGAHVDMTFENISGNIVINGQNGTLFSPITNGDDNINFDDDWERGYYPESVNGQAYVSDFKYTAITGTAVENIMTDNSNTIFVAKTAAYDAATGAGFFAFVMTSKQELTNKDFEATFKIYKAGN